jgi:hypothetical protein
LQTITLAQDLQVYMDGVKILNLPATPIAGHPDVRLTMNGLYVVSDTITCFMINIMINNMV